MANQFGFDKSLDIFKKSIAKNKDVEKSVEDLWENYKKNISNAEKVVDDEVESLNAAQERIKDELKRLMGFFEKNKKDIDESIIKELKNKKDLLEDLIKTVQKTEVDLNKKISELNFDLDEWKKIPGAKDGFFSSAAGKISILEKLKEKFVISLSKNKSIIQKLSVYGDRSLEVIKIAEKLNADNINKGVSGKSAMKSEVSEKVKKELEARIRKNNDDFEEFKKYFVEIDNVFLKIKKITNVAIAPTELKKYSKILAEAMGQRKLLSTKVKNIQLADNNLKSYIDANKDLIKFFASFKIDKLAKEMAVREKEMKDFNKKIKESESSAVENFKKIASAKEDVARAGDPNDNGW